MKKLWLVIGLAVGAGMTLGARHCARIMRGEEACPCEGLGIADSCPCGTFRRQEDSTAETAA